VDLIPSDEQQSFRMSLRRFVESTWGSAELRRLIASQRGFDDDVWQRMAGELGLQGLVVPAAEGGAGSGWTELAITLEEMGRRLGGGPLLSTAALVPALLAGLADEPARTLLASVTAGQLVGAAIEPRPFPHASPVTAERRGAHWRLDGRVRHVLDGPVLDTFVVPATTTAGVRLFAVKRDDAAVAPLSTLDLTRRQADITYAGTPALLLSEVESSERVGRAQMLAAIALAAEQLGGASRCLEMSVEHAGTRHQFGRAIGSFQAVKHMCADMLVDVEAARSAVAYAAWAADNDPAVLAEAAAIAKIVASEAFCRVAGRTIQVHGGIGFTWEHDAHLYYRRAHSTEVLFGSPTEHRAALASGLLGPAA
jgi:alkylation response protein AidB-like acyl-CoA dehydrogenase